MDIKALTKKILQEISSKEELSKEISEYKKNSAKITELQKSIEDVLKNIKSQSDEENKRLKLIIKYMDDFKINQAEGDDWVAELENVPKYKYPSASYKELWEEAMSKLNEATKKVLKQLENTQLDIKRKATEPKLTIKDKENIKEAFKVNDKVKIIGGPKDVRGKEGKIDAKDIKLLKENIITKGLGWLQKLKNYLFSVKEFNAIVNNLPNITNMLGENETPKPSSYMLKQYGKFAMIQKDGKFLKSFNPIEWDEDPNKGKVFEPGEEVFYAKKDAISLGAKLVWVSDLQENKNDSKKTLRKGKYYDWIKRAPKYMFKSILISIKNDKFLTDEDKKELENHLEKM